MGKYVRCVSGEAYLINDFVDNGDGTITDSATALMWTQADSGEGMDWESALAYAQEMNYANYLGYSDWRLPNVKELQSIVDYDYAPDAQDAAYDGSALNPMFSVSEKTNEGGPAGEGGERIYNYVMLVRGGDVTETPDGDPNANDTAPELEFAGASGPSGDASQPPQQSADTNGYPAPPADKQQGDTAGQPTAPGGQPVIDLAAAAETLGVTQEALEAAIDDPGQGVPDFAAAAATLGVTEADLMAVLGVAKGGMSAGSQPPINTP